MKRYRFELTLDVHDFDHLADELRRIARDADLNDIPTERISGGGYWFTMTEREPTMTKERYEAELRAWFDDVRRARLTALVAPRRSRPGRRATRDLPAVSAPSLNDVQVGDWSVWRLAEDKACPESFGWSVVTDVAEPGGNGGWRSRAIGGFTMTFGEAKKQVTDTIAAYGVRGREVLR